MAFFFKPEFINVINFLYGTSLGELAGHTVYIIKMMGCFLFAIALMSIYALKNPLQFYPIIYANALWLLLRGIQRINYIEAFHVDWGISYPRLWCSAIFVIMYAITLFILAKRISNNKAKEQE